MCIRDRDHKGHSDPILGGMWGVKLTPYVRTRMNQSFVDIFDAKLFFSDRNEYMPDMDLLKEYIW